MADSLLGTALQGQKDPEDGNVVTEIGAKKNGNLIQRGDTNPPTGPEDSGNQSGSTTNAQAGAHTTTTLTDTRGQSGGDTTTQQGVKPSQTIPSEPSLQPSPVAELPQSIDFLWGYNHSQIRRWAEELNKVDESLDPKMDQVGFWKTRDECQI
ncbi:hypothetical protein P154DRAFT_521126 [Amniculicola lignicola CBS 123094]|uniref:Uncharacterized protein n=1 Tax=Amniculicola lignicola CBS 123094 TaxID=1392246 RepID=A0A6A5WN45_9PLEO|nr:hypothetical protein P154DRAFT_521126 [Amniculicola lignicola CBS 123094]